MRISSEIKEAIKTMKLHYGFTDDDIYKILIKASAKTHIEGKGWLEDD